MQLNANRRCILRSKDKGEVEFSSIEMEKPTYGNQVTLHPVESGQHISDHVKPDANEYSLQGVIVGTDAPSKLSKLLQFRREGTMLDYIGRNGVQNVVIKGISTEHHVKNRNGLYFTMTLIQIRTASSLAVQIQLPGARPVTHTGQQQPAGEQKSNDTSRYTIVRGDTLSGIARKFNTTVTDLMRLNPQIKNANLIYAGQLLTMPKR